MPQPQGCGWRGVLRLVYRQRIEEVAVEMGMDRGWNLFAVELRAILREHGMDSLGLLDDRAGIHREKVRRLRRSLEKPKSFPTLNPDEMEAAIVAFKLSEDDVLRLRAAMLATAIETLLMDRISPPDALAAARQILPAITEALRAHSGEAAGIGAFTRGGRVPDMDQNTDEALDEALTPAFDLLDRATLDLNLSLYADARAERLERARAARDEYQAALREFAEADDDVRATATWNTWRAEAERGYHTARERVEDLED